MATDALNLVKQLQQETGNLRKLADSVSKAELTKEFGNTLEDVIATLSSVNKDLCVGSSVFVQDYDDLVNGAVANFITLSNQIGGEVAEQAAIFKEAFDAQRAFIALAAECKQPATQTALSDLLKPTNEKIEQVTGYRECRRSSKVFNHLSSVSDAIPILGWVLVPNKPAPYVKEFVGAAMFYTNRILKEYKEKEPVHVEWTKSLVKVIQDLEEYVKKHHLTGVSWNRQGKDAPAAAPAPAGGAPPPPPPGAGGPPPPPPPVVAPSGPAAPAGDDSGRAALFADLNRGGDVTSGLKKVTDDMKTHKNPALRKQNNKPFTQGPTPYKAPSQPKAVSAAKPAAAPAQKPPKTELNQKRWDVEYHSKNQSIVLDEADMRQTVYIYKCDNSVVNIPKKVNSITVDGCKKVGVVCESVLGSFDVVNSQSVQLQITGNCHIVNIDKTDGCMVYLSETCKNAEVISAKSSEMNVLIPNAEGEFTEFPLPEQYRSVYDGKKIVTTCTESMG